MSKKVLTALLASLPCCVFSGTMGSIHKDQGPWSVLGSMGYTNYQSMYHDDGQTALGRFAIQRMIGRFNAQSLGVELGVQSGNTMRYVPLASTINTLGGDPGLPIQTTIKPMMDVLLTTKTALSNTIPLNLLMNAGIAYRRWQFNDRDSISDKVGIAPEIQAGFSYPVSEYSTVNLTYQGVFSGTPKFRFNPDNDSGSVSNMPTQHGILLGLSVAL